MTEPVRPTHEELEARARAICVFMGLYPDEEVWGGDGDNETRYERRNRTSRNLMAIKFARWELHRSEAFDMIMAERTRP
jgi:hypothetical protein